MRRFSQRNQLVTLNDINITPLLDLAFVLLIIFVIATPMMENGIKVDLPGGGQPETQPLQRKDIKLVEVNAEGAYFYEGRPMVLDEIEKNLVQEANANTNMLVYIRGDGDGAYKYVAAALNRCERNQITRISLRTNPNTD